MAVSWLPSDRAASSVRTETGTSARISSPSVRIPRERSQSAQRARDDRQHDVVDRPPERVLDLLVVVELLADDGVAAVRADLDVERRLRRRVEAGPHDLAEAFGGVAETANEVPGRVAAPSAGRRCSAVALTSASDARARRAPPPRARASAATARARRCARRRLRLEVEQHGGEVDAGDPVDERVVGLEDQREAIALEPLDQPALPQRLGAVELLGVDPRRRAEGAAPRSRARAARCGGRGTRG